MFLGKGKNFPTLADGGKEFPWVTARQQLLKYLSGSINTAEPTAIFGMYRDGSARLLQDISTDSVTLGAVKASTGALPSSAADTKITPPSSKLEIESQLMARITCPKKDYAGSGDCGG